MRKMMKLMMVSSLVATLALSFACANIANDRVKTHSIYSIDSVSIKAKPPIPQGLLLWYIFFEEGILAEMAPIFDLPTEGFLVEGLFGLWLRLPIELKVSTIHVASGRSKYATEKAWLAACLTQAQNANLDAEAYNKYLDTVLATYKLIRGTKKYKAIAKELKVTKKVAILRSFQRIAHK